MAVKLTLTRGDSEAFDLEAPDYNFTGGTLFFTIKSAEYINTDTDTDTAALLKKEFTSFTDPPAGKATLTLDPIDTDDIIPGTYKYDVQLKVGSTITTIVPVSDVVIKPDATRRTS